MTDQEPSVPWIHLQPHHWGSHAWTTFHYWTLGYPEVATADEQQNYVTFFQSFGRTIPCQSCRKHFQSLLLHYPPEQHMRSRSDLIRWGVFMHNQVNKRLRKPEMSMDDFVQLYVARTKMDQDRFTTKNVDQIPDWVKWVALATGITLCLTAQSK